MIDDPNACFSPAFVSEFESAAARLPAEYRRITWARSEKGLVAALLGPVAASFVVAVEENTVMVKDTRAGCKIGGWAVSQVTGDMVASFMQDHIDARTPANEAAAASNAAR